METERVVTPADFNREISAMELPEVHQATALPKLLHLKESLAVKLRACWDVLLGFSQKSLFIVLMLLVWEIAPRTGIIDPVFVPSFSSVLKALKELALSGELLTHTLVSLKRAMIGFGIATGVAIPIGFLVGWFKNFEKFVDPGLQALRQLPTLALFPVFILLFGIGEVSKVAIICKACFWPVFLNTVSGV